MVYVLHSERANPLRSMNTLYYVYIYIYTHANLFLYIYIYYHIIYTYTPVFIIRDRDKCPAHSSVLPKFHGQQKEKYSAYTYVVYAFRFQTLECTVEIKKLHQMKLLSCDIILLLCTVIIIVHIAVIYVYLELCPCHVIK